ncbi:hypothetical protein LJY25_15995 [Hymenobacter sp. BT175]|uniref:hypothetical protein n=1 Tax=Hymenobacter translucens TaxID=2886507 RepID=UPI001D0EB428|nr:hypothetical protein [Hymenobacter translucens]MCC2547951.1 hypothetical protein [Hymenobacter translucens]
MKKPLILLLVTLLGLPACGLFTEKCVVVPAPPYYDVEGVQLLAAQHPAGQSQQPLATGQSVAGFDARLEFRVTARFYGAVSPPGGWLAGAYACSPSPPAGYLGTTERIDSFTVVSAYAFDAAHPAGTSLNDVLVDEASGQVLDQALVSVLQGRGYFPRELYLCLRRPPATPGNQQFTVRYHQTNGESYSARTVLFRLN